MKRRIFVVDDEPAIADTLCAILGCSGFEAQAFYTAEAALAATESQWPEFVISDVCMPGMNGVDMAVELKERCPGCRILLFSGLAASYELLQSAHQRGYDFEILLKPVHPKELLAKLDRPNVRSEPYSDFNGLSRAMGA